MYTYWNTYVLLVPSLIVSFLLTLIGYRISVLGKGDVVSYVVGGPSHCVLICTLISAPFGASIRRANF
jgi:hypothetical protein